MYVIKSWGCHALFVYKNLILKKRVVTCMSYFHHYSARKKKNVFCEILGLNFKNWQPLFVLFTVHVYAE